LLKKYGFANLRIGVKLASKKLIWNVNDVSQVKSSIMLKCGVNKGTTAKAVVLIL
jgi:hypothetical protein